MADLRDRQGAIGVNGLDEACKARDEAVVEDTHGVMVVARLLGHHHRLGDDHGDATSSTFRIIQLVPLSGDAVAGAEVGAHGTHDDSVLQLKSANPSRLRQKGSHRLHLRSLLQDAMD